MNAGELMQATDDTHATTVGSGSGRYILGLSGMAQIADAPSDGTTYGRKDGAWVNSGLAGASGVITGGGYSVYVGASGADLEFRGITTGSGIVATSGTGLGIAVAFSGSPTRLAQSGTIDSGSSITASRSDHVHALDSGVSGIIENALTGISGVNTGAGMSVYAGMSGDDIEFRGIKSGSGVLLTSGTGISIDVAFSGAPTRIASTGTPDSGSSITAARSDHTHALDSGLSGRIEDALTGASGVITGGGYSVYVGISGAELEFRGLQTGSGIKATSGTGILVSVEFSGSPTSVASGSTDSGSAITAARSDHMHAINFSGNPSDIGSGASSGSSSVPARIDHVHRFMLTDTQRILGRKSASSGGYEELVISELLGFVSGTEATGDILYKGESAWKRLAKGTAYQLLRQNSTLTAPEWSTAREVLSAARTYYVRTDGSDSNTGLADTAGGAFLTIQKAVDVISSTLDIAGYTVTVQARDGTYTGAVTLKDVLGYSAPGCLIIQGNSVTPTNVVVSTTSANAFTATSIQAVWDIKNLGIATTTTGYGIRSSNATIRFSGIDLGSCAYTHFYASNYGLIQSIGNYTISGGAIYHALASGNGTVNISASTVTVTANVTFTHFAYSMYISTVSATGCTFSLGAYSVTGSRFYVGETSHIYTASGSSTYLPGSSAGTTDATTFGRYS